MQTAFATWAPPLEKSTLTSIQVAGSILALLLTMFVGGLICEKLGWDSLFYITGVYAILNLMMLGFPSGYVELEKIYTQGSSKCLTIKMSLLFEHMDYNKIEQNWQVMIKI